jgi:hypothetical protein
MSSYSVGSASACAVLSFLRAMRDSFQSRVILGIALMSKGVENDVSECRMIQQSKKIRVA